MTTEFNLRALVREVAAASKAADPGDLAEEVFPKIPRKEMASAVREMLRTYVRIVLGESRSVGHLAQEGVGSPGDDVSRTAGRSLKVAAIREAWRARLTDRIHTGPASTAWKLLGDCTADDLLFAADERRHVAERTLSRAVFYERLAEVVKDHGVTSVKELPDDALSSHLEVDEEESE